MLNPQRVLRFINHLLAHAPKWYLAVPFIATISVFCFGMLIDGADSSATYGDTTAPFFSPAIVGMILLYGNTIGLMIVAVHLVSNYFKTNLRTIDTLTFPVSTLERYIVLMLALFLAIPILGILSAWFSFAVLKLSSPFGYYPQWSWMGDKFGFSVLLYLVLAIPFFAVSCIRPKNTWLWGLGVAIFVGLVFATIINAKPDFINTHRIDISAFTDQFPNGQQLYGGQYIGDVYNYPVNPFFHFPNQLVWSISWIAIGILLLFSSAWFALKNRQI